MSEVRVRSDGGVALLRLRRYSDRFHQSLFFLPAIFVFASIVLAFVMVRIDRNLRADDLPSFLSTTVDNARSILSTVAGGTIGSASVVFSLTLVAVQLASSQFSPRVVRGFLGDRFQQTVMGIVVGTFTYSLVVLRVVQEPLDESNAEPFLPQTSIMVAVILAVASLLAVLASIDHTARSLQVGALLDLVANQTVDAIEAQYAQLDDDDDGERSLQLDAPSVVPAAPRQRAEGQRGAVRVQAPADALVLRADRAGWVTQISIEGILAAVPAGSTLLLESAVGTYLIPGSTLATVWPVDDHHRHHVEARFRDAVEVRTARTLQQDVSFGILQLSDVALRALSPAVNDPNTANEVIVRIGRVLSSLLQRNLESSSLTADGKTIVRSRDLCAGDYVDAAIEPIRRYARAEPVVLQTMVRTLATVRDTAQARCVTRVDVSGIDYQLEMIAESLHLMKTDEDRHRVQLALDEVATGSADEVAGPHHSDP